MSEQQTWSLNFTRDCRSRTRTVSGLKICFNPAKRMCHKSAVPATAVSSNQCHPNDLPPPRPGKGKTRKARFPNRAEGFKDRRIILIYDREYFFFDKLKKLIPGLDKAKTRYLWINFWWCHQLKFYKDQLFYPSHLFLFGFWLILEICTSMLMAGVELLISDDGGKRTT